LGSSCRLTVTVRRTDDPAEIAAAHDLRIRVFCGEQGVDASEELDEHEATSTQVVALDESGVVATCRLRPVDGDCKLERMAVERRLRGAGVGSRLLEHAEDIARSEGAGRMVLHAQTRARGFYAANGYEPEGEIFLEADIEHIRMTKPLAAAGA
jgi:predicted GNAT family N-acyltransferase